MSTSTGMAATTAPAAGAGASPASASTGTPASMPPSAPAAAPSPQTAATPAEPAAATQTVDASAAAANAPANLPATQASDAPATATATPATGISFPVRPATTTASTQAPSPAVGHASAADAGSIGGALFSLVLVVGLILGLGWLAKRMPGVQRSGGGGHLRVVASVALGPRDRAVVVDVGGTQLLLGVGQGGGVRHLHTLESPLPVAEASATPSPFAQILAQHFGKKP